MKRSIRRALASATSAVIVMHAAVPSAALAQAGPRASPPTVPAVQPPVSASEAPGGPGAAGQRRSRPPIVVVPDRRIPIVLSADDRARVLGDMRQYLTGIQGILAAMSKEDMRGVAQHARALTNVSLHNVSLAEPSKYDIEFRDLAAGMRKDFQRIADDAERTVDAKRTMGQLGIAMQKCLACHQTFQLNQFVQSPARPSAVEHATLVGELNMADLPDRRVPLQIRPNERNYLLKSMRLYLTGIQTMLVALSQDDWRTVSDTAASMGTINIYDVSLSFASKYDISFRDLAFQTYKDFDAMAQTSQARDTSQTLGQVADTMRKCLACHRTYQLTDSAHSGSESLAR